MNMDVPVRTWSPYRRSLPSSFPLTYMDSIAQKRQWIGRAFGTCNFSLILRGRGEYRRSGRTWAVEAPCVLLQLPGEPLEYGPLVPTHTWDELYLMYDARLLPTFQRHHLLDPARPVWPIADLLAVERRIAELLSVCTTSDPAQVVDCVDRLCELLIVETHLQPAERAGGSEDAVVIRRIESDLAGNLDRYIDLEELVASHGMSPSTFRRRWAEVINVPPARYRIQARLREACRLLAQTPRPVFQIARMVGFSDEMYFSRRLHQEFKVSPRGYRRMQRVCREPVVACARPPHA